MTRRVLYAKLEASVVECDLEQVGASAREVLVREEDPLEAINEGLIKGIEEVGRRFQTGEYFLPELISGAEAMKAGLAILEPELARRNVARSKRGKVVLGTVEGDLHDIGKSLVGLMLTVGGFEVIDLGVDVPARKFVEVMQAQKPDLMGLSALMTTTMTKQRDVIQALLEAGFRERIKVMVGGAAATQGWAQEIGADGYAADAVASVDLATQLMRA